MTPTQIPGLVGTECLADKGYVHYCNGDGGVLVSTHRWKRRRHVEDGSLASLKSGPNKINADHEDLALAA